MSKLAIVIVQALAACVVLSAHAAQDALAKTTLTPRSAKPEVIATEPLPLGLNCKDGSVRAFASGDGFNYSLPVWSEGSPVLCGPGVKGRRLSKSEMDAAVDATYQEYRDHRASLRAKP